MRILSWKYEERYKIFSQGVKYQTLIFFSMIIVQRLSSHLGTLVLIFQRSNLFQTTDISRKMFWFHNFYFEILVISGVVMSRKSEDLSDLNFPLHKRVL